MELFSVAEVLYMCVWLYEQRVACAGNKIHECFYDLNMLKCVLYQKKQRYRSRTIGSYHKGIQYISGDHGDTNRSTRLVLVELRYNV